MAYELQNPRVPWCPRGRGGVLAHCAAGTPAVDRLPAPAGGANARDRAGRWWRCQAPGSSGRHVRASRLFRRISGTSAPTTAATKRSCWPVARAGSWRWAPACGCWIERGRRIGLPLAALRSGWHFACRPLAMPGKQRRDCVRCGRDLASECLCAEGNRPIRRGRQPTNPGGRLLPRSNPARPGLGHRRQQPEQPGGRLDEDQL